MKHLQLFLLLVVSACTTVPATSTATGEARCQNCGDDGNGGGWEGPDAQSYIVNYSSTHYPNSTRGSLDCNFNEDGYVGACFLELDFGGTYIHITCVYPRDGSDPYCF